VGSFGKALLSLGFERFDGINILGFNAPEWFIANFGAIAAGGVSTGIYATNQPEACKYISEDSKARVLVVDGLVQLEKYYKISKKLPNLKAIVMYGPDEFPLDIKNKCSVQCYKFAEFLKLGKSITDQELKKVYDTWKPGEVVELIYTSGTTGPPKAAMITNDNIVWVADTMMKGLVKGMTPDDVLISYLPLSHIAAQGLDMFGPLLAGYQIYFAQSDALKGSLGDTLKEVRPTLFFGVPRVFEKIYGTLLAKNKLKLGLIAHKGSTSHLCNLSNNRQNARGCESHNRSAEDHSHVGEGSLCHVLGVERIRVNHGSSFLLLPLLHHSQVLSWKDSSKAWS
jgi:long-chain-fatty-acid--CoA ligase ACSBG